MTSEISVADSSKNLLREESTSSRRETGHERRQRLLRTFQMEYGEYDDMDRPAVGAPDIQVAGAGFQGSLPHLDEIEEDPHWKDLRAPPAASSSHMLFELPPLSRTLESEAVPSRQLQTQGNLEDEGENLPVELLLKELSKTGGTAAPLDAQQRKVEDENSIVYIRRKQLSVYGCFVAIFYLSALSFYFGIRITRSLQGLGNQLWYGVLLLIMEMFGAVGMLFAASVMVWKPVMDPYLSKDNTSLRRPLRRTYNIRVLIPCYKESLFIVKKTVEAIVNCYKPLGVEVYVYICDDGRDEEKRNWVNICGMGNVFYFSGRKRARGEMNGKSSNLNNALMLIYGKCPEISLSEVVCILDADQVAAENFVMKTLPVMDFGDNIALVLTPQCVFNVPAWQDIFNHGNIHFWEYLQPGYDAVGFISCSGTNMLLRARALKSVGWFPTNTLTEDWSLGMEFKVKAWEGRYVNEYLCMGEAPLEVRNAFQQRSRWCKGHFQIFFTKQCPLFNTKLTPYFRIMFSSTILTYVAAGLVTPFLHLVPLITIWTGLMPLVFDLWVVLSLTIYYVASNMVQYQSVLPKKMFSLWYSSVSTNILWYAYLKAATLSVLRTLLGKLMSFKATAKGRLGVLSKISFQDLWVHMVLVGISIPTFIVGVVNLDSIKNLTILIALCWVLWNMLPSILVLYYAVIGSKGTHFTVLCMTACALAQLLPLLADILLWMLYPRNVDYSTVSHKVFTFLDAQWSGFLPSVDQILPWRRSSALDDGVILGGANYSLAGGFYTGSLVGHTKLTKNIAYTVTMLAWTSLTFYKGVKNVQMEERIERHIKWGVGYLERTFVEHPNNIRNHTIIAAVGNCTIEHQFWGRPEDMTHKRPAYMVAAYQKPADLAAQMSAAFVSSAMYLYKKDPKYSAVLYKKAVKLYNISTNFKGSYTDIESMEDINTYYPSTSYFDDMAWAATWLFFASSEEEYYKEALNWYDRHIYKEMPNRDLETTESHYFNIDNMFWATNTLLFQSKPNIHRFRGIARLFLNTWVCQATYTRRGRAFWPPAQTLGDTANAALLAMMYSAQYRYDSDDKSDAKFSSVYECYARGQMRYMLGYDTALTSFVAGQKINSFGRAWETYPKHIQHRAASCKGGPSLCSRENAYDVSSPNPHVLIGALVEGPAAKRVNSLMWELSDVFEDKRYLNGSRVSLEGNLGLIGLTFAGAQVKEVWAKCLGGYGVLNTKHPIC
eukprot:TRINITY_DN939_c0_g1_i1.p1 TRINITY_DN939_c0_g1~~TRINITY_DN939_c0_g1_i1.p1  ORF type:complete len:1224 (-),score=215.19 TRINITY_DN939_c0_g1_i1:956-4627(-)